MCPNAGLCQNTCQEECGVFDNFSASVKVDFTNGGTWYRPQSKKEIFEILEMSPDNGYMLFGGNTAHGETFMHLK